MKTFISIILLTLCVIDHTLCTTILPGNTKFRNDYIYHAEIDGWLKLHLMPATWTEARHTCQLEGAELASPENPALLEAMTLTMYNVRYDMVVFTGTNSMYSPRRYFSIKGVPLETMPLSWAFGLPSSDDEKRSIILFTNGTIHNVYANASHPFTCYKPNKNEPLNTCGTIDNEYQYNNALDACYKFHPLGATWHDAFETCAAEGAHLAIANSEREMKFFFQLMITYQGQIKAQNNQYSFIGVTKWQPSGQWYTIHGQTLAEVGYIKWGKGEPHNDPKQNCIALWRGDGFADAYCDTKLSFICENKMGTLQSSTPYMYRQTGY